MDDDITTTVTAVAATELGVSAALLTAETDLRAVPGMDSVKVLRMIAKIEQTYEVELDDEVVFALSTIASVSRAVDRALQEQA